MSDKYKFTDPDGMYFTTTTVVGWIDLFTRPELKHIVLESIRYCQKEKGLIVHAWCLMPSHLHMIVSTSGEPLSDIFRDFKKFTSVAIVKEIESNPESCRDWILEIFIDVAFGLNRVKNYKVWPCFVPRR